NRDALMQPYRQRAGEQAANLLGAPAASTMNTDEQGLTSGVSTQGSGLMQGNSDQDYFQQMQYAQGLMNTPGFESAGLNFQNQALQHQLGGDARDQAQTNWQATYDQNELVKQQQLKKDRLGITNTFRDDFEKASAPYRAGTQIYQDFQNMAKSRGAVSNWTMIDDVASIKNAAKLILPAEAVIGDDASLLAQTDKLPVGLQTLINQALGMGKPLTDNQRRDLAQTISERSYMQSQRLDQLENTYRGYAEQESLRSEQIVRPRLEQDTTRYTQPAKATRATNKPAPSDTVGDSQITQQQLDDEYERLHPRGKLERIWDEITR
ncbi:unnamed protein product, partial [marine sediment metagenome]